MLAPDAVTHYEGIGLNQQTPVTNDSKTKGSEKVSSAA